jgi:SAM-dependent methyltransferase
VATKGPTPLHFVSSIVFSARIPTREVHLTKNADELVAQSYPTPTLPALGAMDRWTARAKGFAKRIIDIYFSAKCSVLRAVGIIDFSLPPNHILRRTSSFTIRHYYESGLTTFMPIATCAIAQGVDLDQPIKVLDFACGAGRQLLHLTRLFPNVQAYACDIRADAIAYLHRAYPKASVYANKFDPPLVYDDNAFDLIYSVSVFSHLLESDARLWLRELHRVAKRGRNPLPDLQQLHVSRSQPRTRKAPAYLFGEAKGDWSVLRFGRGRIREKNGLGSRPWFRPPRDAAYHRRHVLLAPACSVGHGGFRIRVPRCAARRHRPLSGSSRHP